MIGLKSMYQFVTVSVGQHCLSTSTSKMAHEALLFKKKRKKCNNSLLSIKRFADGEELQFMLTVGNVVAVGSIYLCKMQTGLEALN